MDTYLTKLEAEIAEVERQIGVAKRERTAMTRRCPQRLDLDKQIKALEAKHEDLVMRVQQATVGAAKPGQVL